jgi:hypothetical protein
MLWVTRRSIRVNRTATAWLVRRFVDPSATFRFTDPTEVARVQACDGAVGFDAPGARYAHKDASGRCSFEALVDEYQPRDGTLSRLARIVHRADFPEEDSFERSQSGRSPESLDTLSLVSWPSGLFSTEAADRIAGGLRAISRGFPLVAADDHETLERSAFLYDALYASLQKGLVP